GKINCATVPTTISDSAVEMRSQIENSPAINARLNQSAASAHTLVMPSPRLFARWSAWTGRQQKPALRRGTHGLPPRLSREGALAIAGGFWGVPPPPPPRQMGGPWPAQLPSFLFAPHSS